MADTAAVGGVGTFPEVEGGGGARAMMGGSLPPRKRLLAGLKQNGLWLSASSQASPSTPASVNGPEGGAMEGRGVMERSPDLAAALGEAKGNCMRCGAMEGSAWRRMKWNGTTQRLCNSCDFLSNKKISCPHCQVACTDLKDPCSWLQCYRCRRVVHVECEKSAVTTPLDPVSYVCAECIEPKTDHDVANGLAEVSADACVGRAGMNCTSESGNCASSAATGCPSPCSKKSRISKESRSKSNETVARDAGMVERTSNDANAEFEHKGVTSQGAGVAAAEAAAALAGRAAVLAKATAAAKAVAAVKAAAAAKAALEAAAFAARAEVQARAELRRSSIFWERAAVVGGSKCEASHLETKKDRASKPDVKTEEEEIPGATPSSIGDEELARQLHRVINSSPRISRGLTPLRGKPSGQTGTVSGASDSVRVWPRSGTATEPRTQLRQQQTRPRSMSQKDVKRLESRVVKHESSTADSDSCQNSLQQLVCTTASDDAGQLVALGSEPPASRTVTLVRQNSRPPQRQDTSSALTAALVKTETDHVNGAAPQVFDGVEGNQGRIPLAFVSCQAATMTDLLLMSKAIAKDAAKELFLPRVPIGMSPHLEEELCPSRALFAVATADVRELEEREGRNIAERAGVVDMCSGVTTLAEVASSTMEVLEKFPAVSPSVAPVESWSAIHGDGDGLQAEPHQDNSGQLIVEGPRSRPEFTVRAAKGASEFEDVEGLCQAAVHGKSWQQATMKGVTDGGQGFASGVHLSPFSSAPPVPIFTPAHTSTSTSRHS